MILTRKFLIIIFHSIFSSQNKKKSECDTCIEFTDFFNIGLVESQSNTYEGGTSYGQSKKLLNYADSELRMITILEKICDKSDDRKNCKSFLEKYEDEIEDWFKNMRNENIELHKYLCIDVSKACCPVGFYGEHCEKCKGLIDNILCGGHGRCHGDGTRRGNGNCICNEGFTGILCDECTNRTFINQEGNCELCHESCEGPCTDATEQGCQGNCRKGWLKNEKNVCVDFDECGLETHDCKFLQNCRNTPGSYVCEDCHHTCLKCNGSTIRDCEICAAGLEKKEDLCVDIDECKLNTHNCSGMTYCKNNYGSYECLNCNKGCKEGCSGPSLKECNECGIGYRKDAENGCIDIDECQNKGMCGGNQYCKNKNGGFECLKCDKSCSTCHGPGPHSCDSCAEMHHVYKGFCQHILKIAQDKKKEKDEL